MHKSEKKQRKELIRIVEYMITGGAYFWSGYLMFFALDKGLHWSLWWAKLVANITGWIVNYVLQRYWVFSDKKLAKHQTEVTGRYITITLVDFILDYLIVAWLKGIGISPYIGQFISSGFFTFWNYLWYRFWVFPTKFKKHSTKFSLPRLLAHRAHNHGAYRRPAK